MIDFRDLLPGSDILRIISPCLFLFTAAWLLSKWHPISNRNIAHAKEDISNSAKTEVVFEEYESIEPLPDFRWQETNPIQLRPFRPKYHLTMALTNSTASELILFDKTYLSRMKLRRELLAKYPSTIIGELPRVATSVQEFYVWVFGTYLPSRYPNMFRRSTMTTSSEAAAICGTQTYTAEASALHNLATDELIPLRPPQNITEALRTLTIHIDEDFLFLLPHESGDGSYVLAGFSCCFANGFDLSKLIGQRVREIHGPVPGYKERLQKSMDRYFERLPVGKFVKRCNWGISTSLNLFAAFDTTHGREGDNVKDDASIDPTKTYVRCELQTLHRLPKTRGLIFAFHTYMYPLPDIKADGSGPSLASAIAGLDQGNVPGMSKYKRKDVWGRVITDYLTSDES